jgi:hypothetical protein
MSLPPIPPARPAKSSAQGPGAAAGDDRTKTASAADRPKGGRILVRSGGDAAGGPYAELPDGSGDQAVQPAAGGPRRRRSRRHAQRGPKGVLTCAPR